MNAKQAEEIRQNPELLKRLTKCVALHAFAIRSLRASTLAKFHAPRQATFSDVKVNFPNGEIPWTELSRFDVNHTYRVMFELFAVPDKDLEDFLSALRQHDPQPEWDEPKIAFALPG